MGPVYKIHTLDPAQCSRFIRQLAAASHPGSVWYYYANVICQFSAIMHAYMKSSLSSRRRLCRRVGARRRRWILVAIELRHRYATSHGAGTIHRDLVSLQSAQHASGLLLDIRSSIAIGYTHKKSYCKGASKLQSLIQSAGLPPDTGIRSAIGYTPLYPAASGYHCLSAKKIILLQL